MKMITTLFWALFCASVIKWRTCLGFSRLMKGFDKVMKYEESLTNLEFNKMLNEKKQSLVCIGMLANDSLRSYL